MSQPAQKQCPVKFYYKSSIYYRCIKYCTFCATKWKKNLSCKIKENQLCDNNRVLQSPLSCGIRSLTSARCWLVSTSLTGKGKSVPVSKNLASKWYKDEKQGQWMLWGGICSTPLCKPLPVVASASLTTKPGWSSQRLHLLTQEVPWAGPVCSPVLPSCTGLWRRCGP